MVKACLVDFAYDQNFTSSRAGTTARQKHCFRTDGDIRPVANSPTGTLIARTNERNVWTSANSDVRCFFVFLSTSSLDTVESSRRQ